MSDWIRDECDSCREPIIWATTTNAKAMPVDYEPSDNGNISLQPGGRGPLAIVLGATKRFGRKDLRTSHFVTCPDSKSWRKRDRQATA